jgi:hypothetical protein
MKSFVAAILCLFAAAQAQGERPAVVDLTRPGALEALKARDPQRYEKVSAVLQVAERMSCKQMEPHVFKAAGLNVEKAECGTLLLTSLPAKRYMSFTIDDTDYHAIVSMQDSVAFPLPAR